MVRSSMNYEDCDLHVTIKALEYRHACEAFGQGKACSCAPMFVSTPLRGAITEF